MNRFSRRLRRRAKDDAGIVLGVVLVTSLLMSLFVVASLGYVVGQMPQTREQLDRRGALAAAEAGVDAYLDTLNLNTEYWVNGASARTDPDINRVLPVPGSNGQATYKITKVDGSTVREKGYFEITATGTSGGESRTIRVQVSRPRFTDYAYMSDVEVSDPLTVARYRNEEPNDRELYYYQATELTKRCSQYEWTDASRTPPDDTRKTCAVLPWGGDVIDGNAHTNDIWTLAGNGPGWAESTTFNGTASVGCPPPGCGDQVGSTFKNYRALSGNSPTPSFKYGAVEAAGIIPFPLGNNDLRLQAISTGCLYSGPTRIILRGDKADVYSRYSRSTNSPGRNCGGNLMGTGSKMATIDIPPTGLVIYVQDIPTDPSSPNRVVNPSSVAPFIPGPNPENAPSSYRPTVASGATKAYPTGTYKFPLPEDRAWTQNFGIWGPRDGDVLIEGELSGQLTIASQNDIIVTGDIRYQDTSAASLDVLGLVADNFIYAYHPVSAPLDRTATPDVDESLTYRLYDPRLELCANPCMQNLRIDAVLMAVRHSFGTMNYGVGEQKGEVLTYGSLIQKWRNNVGNGIARPGGGMDYVGYGKKYTYDPKLRYVQPPFFLQPEGTRWQVSRWSEVSG